MNDRATIALWQSAEVSRRKAKRWAAKSARASSRKFSSESRRSCVFVLSPQRAESTWRLVEILEVYDPSLRSLDGDCIEVFSEWPD